MKSNSNLYAGKVQSSEKGVSGAEQPHRQRNPAGTSPLHPSAKNTGKQGPNEGEAPKNHTSPCFTLSPSGGFVLTLGPNQYPFRQWEPADGRVIAGRFALDTETTKIDENRPAHVPTLVLGAAFDGRQGWFILAEERP